LKLASIWLAFSRLSALFLWCTREVCITLLFMRTHTK
jgi:hypothetical protein